MVRFLLKCPIGYDKGFVKARLNELRLANNISGLTKELLTPQTLDIGYAYCKIRIILTLLDPQIWCPQSYVFFYENRTSLKTHIYKVFGRLEK